MDSARGYPALNEITVRSLDDERLEPYRNQKDAWLRAHREGGTGIEEGLFLAEGELVVRTLIGSHHEVLSVLCTPTRLGAMRAELARLPEGTPVFVAERPVLEEVIGFDLHRGILALGRRREPPVAAALVERAGVLIVCEDLSNHDNMGAVFRNAACLAGARAAVLLSPRCCDPLYRKSLRVSMGHALRVPFATLSPWPGALGGLASAGFALLALTPGADAVSVCDTAPIPNHRPAILLGAEGPGLTAGAMAAATGRVRIPMAEGADSLNVATALAVVLSHLAGWVGQREEPPGVGASP